VWKTRLTWVVYYAMDVDAHLAEAVATITDTTTK
jgi:hypothetical protein